MSVSFWIQMALYVYNWSSSKERRKKHLKKKWRRNFSNFDENYKLTDSRILMKLRQNRHEGNNTKASHNWIP